MEGVLPKTILGKQVLSDLEKGMSLEWIVTNGLGGYASSTVLGINTRKYHGLLVASFNAPVDRRVMVSKLDEQLIVNGKIHPLGATEFSHGMHPQGYRYLERFSQFPFPTFTYSTDKVKLCKTIIMPHQKNATVVFYETLSSSKATLQICPLVNARHFHAVTDKDSIDWSFDQKSALQKATLQVASPPSTLVMSSNCGHYVQTKQWIKGVFFRTDNVQGTSCFDDCYLPGQFEIILDPDEMNSFFVVAVAGKDADDVEEIHSSLLQELRNFRRFYKKEAERLEELSTNFYMRHLKAPQENWLKCLVLAADSFVAKRLSTKTRTVIAGYHWFEDWGRDSLISLPGLTLISGRFDFAREILLTFKHYCNDGIVPNRFPDEAGEKPAYNTVDATLWYFNAVLQYLKYSGDFDFVRRKLWMMLQSVIDYHSQGTINDIRLEDDGLIVHGPQLTWMDVILDNNPVTPRAGKAVEIQGLWYNALKTMQLLATYFKDGDLAERYGNMAERAQKSFMEKFWNPQENCLFDVINGEAKDASLRPNQLLTVSLDFSMLDKTHQSAIVSIVHDKLWACCGLRTLSQEDPKYRGRYRGNWSERNYAYHNGTAWPWLIGSFVTAFLKTKGYSDAWRKYAFESFLQPLFREQTMEAGLGTLSEVLDGDPPHSPGGCISQAWSVAEPLRAYVEDILLDRPNFEENVLEKFSRTESK